MLSGIEIFKFFVSDHLDSLFKRKRLFTVHRVSSDLASVENLEKSGNLK